MTDDQGIGQPDEFAPLSAEEMAGDVAATGASPPDAETWTPIVPAPSEPPPPSQIRHSKYGPASRAWVYRSATGEPLFATARFDFAHPDRTPGKVVLPYTYGFRAWQLQTGSKAGQKTHRTDWQIKRPHPPVPLYGLDRLAKRPGAAVLVCEGEKAADAAAALFPACVCITSQGGSGAAGNADWSPLAGRDVTIWPDKDGPGAGYSSAVVQEAGRVRARSVRVVGVPAGWPESWDLADALPEGVAPDVLAELLDAARLVSLQHTGGVDGEVAAAEIARVARLNELEYAQQRTSVAKTLAIGVGALDRLRTQRQNEVRAAEIAGTGGEREDQECPATDDRGRTYLFIDDADLPDSAASLIVELARCERLFDRNGPSRLERDSQHGGLVAKPLTVNGVVTECHTVCRPYKLKRYQDGKVKRVEVTLPERVAGLCLDMRDRWRLRPLDGIASAPLLHADGSIRVVDGYDPETRLWCEGVPAVNVPDAPTLEDARAALLRVRTRFRSFAFADAKRIVVPGAIEPVVDVDLPPGKDESAYVVMLMTSVCRPSLWLAPGALIRSSEVSGSGTGKGLLIRSMCAVAYGMQPEAMTLGRTPEETEKRITGALIGAKPAIFLDNVNGVTLKSDVLELAITERPASVRPLGTSNPVPLNSSALVTVSGNGVLLSGDTTRRFILAELDAGTEDAESRQFDGNFLVEVQGAREEVLHDLLVIWRWGRLQGDALPRGRPLGSFTDWGQWCRDPLLALGCCDPVARIASAKAADPKRAFLGELFTAWWQQHGDSLVKVSRLAGAVKKVLDPDLKGRQFQTAKLRHLEGTRAAGYQLKRIEPIGKWSADLYKLASTTDATPEEGVGGIEGIEGTGRVDAQPEVKRTMPADHPVPEDWSTPLTLEDL